MEKEEAEQKIKDIVDFTCSYWWPLWKDAQDRYERGECTQMQAAVIYEIISNRSAYVEELRQMYLSPPLTTNSNK